MNNNFNLKQYLTEGKLLNEIEIKIPRAIPIFKTNAELLSYLEKNPEEYQELMNEILKTQGYGEREYNFLNDDGSIWSLYDMWDLDQSYSFDEQDPELTAFDVNDNLYIISIKPMKIKFIRGNNDEEISQGESTEWGPNNIYFASHTN